MKRVLGKQKGKEAEMKRSKGIQRIFACMLALMMTLGCAMGNLPAYGAQEADSQIASTAETQTDTTSVEESVGKGESAPDESVTETTESSVAKDAENESSVGEPNEGAAESTKSDDAQQSTFTYEDDSMTVTATAGAGVLPKDVDLSVVELTPASLQDKEGELSEKERKERSKQFAEAVQAVAKEASERDKRLTDARAYDIHFLDKTGNEVEPAGTVDVRIIYKDDRAKIGTKGTVKDSIELSHIKDDGKVEPVATEVAADRTGKVEEVQFAADSFSIYVIFDTNRTSNIAPYNVGQYGWIRFGGDNWKADSLPRNPGFDDTGWARYLKVNIYTLNNGGNSSNPNDYSFRKSFEHLATWAENFNIETSQFNGTVRMTRFRRAHSANWQQFSGLQSSYASEVYYTTWNPWGFDGDTNELNIYIDTGDTPSTPTPSDQTGTNYIIRYYHDDGSYDQVDGVLTTGQTVSVDQGDKIKSGEVYSGTSIATGQRAATINSTTGIGTISYDAGTSLVKVNVYYKDKVEKQTGGTVTGAPQYDAEVKNGTKIYDTSRDGLHTDKTASAHTDGAGGTDGRTFDLKLESWNIGTNMANVGMVFDASGSMVWTSDHPERMQKTRAEWTRLLGHDYQDFAYLPDEDVNKILDLHKTDNSKLNYNGYKYYIYDYRTSVAEYVPLGYSDGTVHGNSMFMDGHTMATYVYASSRGWYYVNSAGRDVYLKGEPYSGKQYVGVPANQSKTDVGTNHPMTANSGWGASSSPVKFYIDSTGSLKCFYYYNEPNTSYVYSKADDADTKSEVLQRSVGKFAETLNSLSPESQVSMVRFSAGGFQPDELALLNWTNDTAKITAAMNQTYGNAAGQGGKATTTLDGMTVYNYGFTGATHTYKGIEAFMADMTRGQWYGYAPTSTNGAASKYLIIFTDGKDNSGNEAQAIQDIEALKRNGYTVMTVLMESAGMTSQDVTDSTAFLKNLASESPNGTDYFYSARYDNADELVKAFQEMAQKIAEPLQGYTVRDYLDPRFDLLDTHGEVLTVLNGDGTFTSRRVNLSDGKQATLSYDAAKKMFYLDWTNQEIPTTTKGVQGDQKVSVWSSTITVRAKKDFLGGNNILTNGNEPGQNKVFDPNNNGKPKDFPRTTVNPAVLTPDLSNYEDTIFLGEEIKPGEIHDKLAGDDWFAEYLERIGAKDGKDYIETLKRGQTVEVPYYYLKDPNDDASYAGGTLHQNDKVGGLRYEWAAYDTGGNLGSNDDAYVNYTTVTVNDVKYYLKVTYRPDDIDYGSNDQYKDNGTPRTLTLTGQSGTNKLIRDPVGNKQVDCVSDTGKAVIHVVDGRLRITKEVNKADLLHYLESLGPQDKLTFSFKVNRDENQGSDQVLRTLAVELQNNHSENGASPIPHEVSNKTETIHVTWKDVNEMTADADGNIQLIDCWEIVLPKGTYSLAEEISRDGILELSVSAVKREQITDDTETNYREIPEKGSWYEPSTGDVKWFIGQLKNDVPADISYTNSSFSDQDIEDDEKEVDPVLSENNGKHYLNAQIGEAILVNTFIKKDFSIEKQGTGDDALEGAEFSLYPAQVSADNSWTKASETAAAKAASAITDQSQGKALADFKGIAPGTYLLYETKVPSGYLAPEHPWRVTITKDLVSIKDKDGKDLPKDGSFGSIGGFVFIIHNELYYELPSAAGPGTYLFTISGVAILFASLLLVIKNRRKEDLRLNR
jgi:hypothetical protein